MIASGKLPARGPWWWTSSRRWPTACSFAHQQDIVHRDVKPSNIMVMKNGAREDHRLRHRAPAQLRGEDDDGLDPRLAALHVARAGDRQGDRRAQRHLLAGRRALRGAHRRGALRRRQRERDHVRDREHHAAAALRAQPRGARRCWTSSSPRRWRSCSRTATSRSRSSATTCARCAGRWTRRKPAAALKAMTAPPSQPPDRRRRRWTPTRSRSARGKAGRGRRSRSRSRRPSTRSTRRCASRR